MLLTMSNRITEAKTENKNPTYVFSYHVEFVKKEKCLDNEGTISIALKKSGDYDDADVPGCRVKIARKAGRAKFGRDLGQLFKNTLEGIRRWKETLGQRLRQTGPNSSKRSTQL